MTTFTVGKSSPSKSDMKNASSLAMKSRQQAINEVNKRRTLLQDNSWIKKRPEEENTDENYGRVVLNQYKSQDDLHSKEPDISVNTSNVTSPVKKKRQSWMPPPVSNQKATTDDVEQHKRHSWAPPNTAAVVAINNKPVPTTSDKSGGPKMTIYSSEPVTSPKSTAVVNDQPRTRQVCPTKPSESDANSHSTVTTERIGRSQDLDNLIEVKATGDKSDQGSQGLDNLIEVKATSDKNDQGGRNLDDLITVNNTAQKNRRNQELDNLIEIKPSTVDQKKKQSQELDDFIEIKSSAVDQNKKRAPEQGSESANIPGNQSDTSHLYQVTRGSSRFPHDAYEDNTPGKSIKTVYSTSDRAVIEKEMCTYCRKPLGTDTKMILNALQICCHATCFKCEVCKAPLENLKAGDSIWIHKNTVHCTPCYSKVKASWVY